MGTGLGLTGCDSIDPRLQSTINEKETQKSMLVCHFGVVCDDV